MQQHYVIRIHSASALPTYLFKQQVGDRRRVSADLGTPHDLILDERLTDTDELMRRTFNASEALAACAEWQEIQPMLDVLVAEARVTLVLQPVESFLAASPRQPLLRMLPLVRDGGGLIEPQLSVAAWASTRVRPTGRESLFHRRADDAPALCAEVIAVRAHQHGVQNMSSRVSVDPSSTGALERFGFAEQSWLGAHFGGHDLANAMSVSMTPHQARRLADELALHPEFTDVTIRVSSIRDFVGSAEFESGISSRPVRFERAASALSSAVGACICWVVWPDLEA